MGHSVYVSFRCDSDLDRRSRIEAAKLDMNRTEFIIEALWEKLERIDATSTQGSDQPNA